MSRKYVQRNLLTSAMLYVQNTCLIPYSGTQTLNMKLLEITGENSVYVCYHSVYRGVSYMYVFPLFLI